MYGKSGKLVGAISALPAVLAMTCVSPVHADAKAESSIKAVLHQYQDALNASSTAQVMPLYTDDGIFMWEFNPSVVGKANLKTAYDTVFRTITLQVQFKVQEVVQMSRKWAFARTSSSGVQTMKQTGQKTAEGNQELFLFHKETNGMWRIARYCFGSTNPPR